MVPLQTLQIQQMLLFLLRKLHFVTADTSPMSLGNPLELWLLAQMFCTLDVICWRLSRFCSYYIMQDQSAR